MLLEIFDSLRAAGMVRSENEFSIEWLGMEESYVRCMKFKDRTPSPRALINCAVKLKNTADALKASRVACVNAQGDKLRALARDCVTHVLGDDLQELWAR